MPPHAPHIPHRAAVPARPERVRVLDELGRSRTLDTSPNAYACLFANTSNALAKSLKILLLGIGPEPDLIAALLATQHIPSIADICFVECHEFTTQLPPSRTLPPHWHALTSHEALQQMRTWHSTAQEWAIWSYTPETRLFSRFWGPVLGYILTQGWKYPPESAETGKKRRVNMHEDANASAVMDTNANMSAGEHVLSIRRASERPPRTILIPGHDHGLLSTELASGFAAHGFTPLFVPVEPDACLKTVLAHLQNERPALFFTVNLQGFDPDGLLFQALQACHVPTGTWFVDNPWHVLSQLRAPWWQELSLFVSDASFIAELQRHAGPKARAVTHLPLAACFTHALPADHAPSHACNTLSPLVFVGRSAFPHRDSFFAGCQLPAPLLNTARAHLTHSPLPDVQWWGHQLGITTWWPGTACRQAGFGAEQCSMERRALWLRTASDLGLTVYGDNAWKTLLPSQVSVRPPVDYYSTLPHIYATAPYSLNVTSLLLPAGLTQRHFDVWMAGGLLLTDATPGLALFPAELTEPISLSTPNALHATLERFERDPLLRSHLQQAWQALLQANHTYPHRADTILANTGLHA